MGDIDVLLCFRDETDERGRGADVAPVSVIGKMRHAADLIAGEDSAVRTGKLRHIAERHDGTGDFDIPLRLKIQHFTHEKIPLKVSETGIFVLQRTEYPGMEKSCVRTEKTEILKVRNGKMQNQKNGGMCR